MYTEAILSAVGAGLIYGLGAILAATVFYNPRTPVTVVAGTGGARTPVSVDHSGLHRRPGRGRRGHVGDHRA